jgi:hypothetical protein
MSGRCSSRYRIVRCSQPEGWPGARIRGLTGGMQSSTERHLARQGDHHDDVCQQDGGTPVKPCIAGCHTAADQVGSPGEAVPGGGMLMPELAAARELLPGNSARGAAGTARARISLSDFGLSAYLLAALVLMALLAPSFVRHLPAFFIALVAIVWGGIALQCVSQLIYLLVLRPEDPPRAGRHRHRPAGPRLRLLADTASQTSAAATPQARSQLQSTEQRVRCGHLLAIEPALVEDDHQLSWRRCSDIGLSHRSLTPLRLARQSAPHA